MDAGAWPISPPKSLQRHLPKPSPVSLPITTASHHASGARGDSSDGRSLYGGRGEETQVDSTQVGG